jgi:hypothetical protein
LIVAYLRTFWGERKASVIFHFGSSLDLREGGLTALVRFVALLTLIFLLATT